MPEFTGTRDLRGYLGILWRWKLIFVFFLVAAPVAAYLIQRGQQAEYQSSALVGVNQATVNTSLVGGGSFTTDNVTAIAQLVTTSPVAAVAADLMHPRASAGEIVGEVSASGNTATDFVTISAVDPSPVRAAAIANAFAHALAHSLQSSQTGEVNRAIANVERQLAHLRRHDPTRPTLEQQLTQLRAAQATQGSRAAVLQPAGPGSPTKLNSRRTIEIGLVIGLLLAIGAVVLAENADRRLRTPHDLESMTELPLLAAIAPSAFSGMPGISKEDEEAFHMLRTALTYFNRGNNHSGPDGAASTRLQSILITSPGEEEGKTTIATKLAIVAAEAGLRVILIDADLRRAQVAPRLRIDQEQGLSAVLTGECSFDQSLVDCPIEDTNGRLTVLPAGPSPRRPGVLIDSPAMRQVLAEAESRSDLVIIDSPAALAVSDPLPLMRRASGVVMVARMGRSTRETVGRLHRLVQVTGGSAVGVVATGVTAAPGYGYYSPKYYTRNGAGDGIRLGKAPEAEAGEKT